jgi:ATP-dependent exoDNAse (exonuclease V) alpha subunit
MIAGPNVVRRALNARARRLLHAHGALRGTPLVEGGREFLVGDWVVARRNDRTLTSTDGRWVKNGSAGVVTAVDHDQSAVTVAFDREGSVTIPRRYLVAGHLDHGYARTTYGVQGATLDRALYHAGDEASFEEGYVALTRGRRETRIFLVDGSLAGRDADAEHKAHDLGSTGLSTVAAAMDRRRAKALAHESDPLASVIACGLTRATLAELRSEREQIEGLLRQAPRDVSDALQTSCEELDRAATQRRVYQEDLDRLMQRAQSRNPLTRRSALAGAPAVRERLADLDRRMARLRERETSLRTLWRSRAAWLDEHRAESDRLQVLLRAEHARAAEVRAAALQEPPEAMLRLLGPEPEDLTAMQAWRHAVGEAAVHLDRYGTVDPPEHRGLELWSHQQAAHAVDHARTLSAERAGAVTTIELEL